MAHDPVFKQCVCVCVCLQGDDGDVDDEQPGSREAAAVGLPVRFQVLLYLVQEAAVQFECALAALA
jgi:hypothetical protein